MPQEYVVSVLFKVFDKATAPLRGIKHQFDRLEPSFANLGARLNRISDRFKQHSGEIRNLAMAVMASTTLPTILLAKKMLDLEEQIGAVVIQADKGLPVIDSLKKKLYEVATLTGQKPEGLISAVGEIVERSGNFQFAVNVIKELMEELDED